MICEIFESERLLFKPFSMLSAEEKEIVIKSWSNPFNARYNAMKDVRSSVESLCCLPQPTFQDLQNYDDCMYFRVVFDRETKEVVGTCRFGKYYNSKTNDCWDFGFNVVLKHWGKGYGVEILKKIVALGGEEGVKIFRGGADIENYASYKAMIKNGFEFEGYDEDGDYEYLLNLPSQPKSPKEIEGNWLAHIERTKIDLGIEKFENLEKINKKIGEMVTKIQLGEDENVIVQKYFKKLDEIEKFKFS